MNLVNFKKYLMITLTVFFAPDLLAQGFITLPDAKAESAYVLCNTLGDFGSKVAKLAKNANNDACSVSTPKLIESPLNAPMEGFRLIGMMISDVVMPTPEAGADSAVAVLSDAIWRNKENTECILGTHLQMKDAPLANGKYLEVNDIARAGFADRDLSIAYFYKLAAPEIGGDTEVLFRAGRSFTSAQIHLQEQLPQTKGAPAAKVAISESNTAAFSANWVIFTTDLSFKDDDGVTRPHSSIFYIKYACDARDPVSKPNAIRFRTIGQNGKKTMEISAPALVPADAQVELY